MITSNNPATCRVMLPILQMLNLSTFPAGQQLMNIFNTDGLVLTPSSSLDSALQLIDAHNALQP